MDHKTVDKKYFHELKYCIKGTLYVIAPKRIVSMRAIADYMYWKR